MYSSFYFVIVERETPYTDPLSFVAAIAHSYMPDTETVCSKVDLNKRTAIYFPQVLVEQYAKVSSTAKIQFSNLPKSWRIGGNKNLLRRVRIFVNKGSNFAGNCHNRLVDGTEVEVAELKSSRLDTRYLSFEIGFMLQKIFNSLYWRYGMSLVVDMEPLDIMNLPGEDIFPDQTRFWNLHIPNQPGNESLFTGSNFREFTARCSKN